MDEQILCFLNFDKNFCICDSMTHTAIKLFVLEDLKLMKETSLSAVQVFPRRYRHVPNIHHNMRISPKNKKTHLLQQCYSPTSSRYMIGNTNQFVMKKATSSCRHSTWRESINKEASFEVVVFCGTNTDSLRNLNFPPELLFAQAA